MYTGSLRPELLVNLSGIVAGNGRVRFGGGAEREKRRGGGGRSHRQGMPCETPEPSGHPPSSSGGFQRGGFRRSGAVRFSSRALSNRAGCRTCQRFGQGWSGPTWPGAAAHGDVHGGSDGWSAEAVTNARGSAAEVLLDDRAALVANCIGRSRQGIGIRPEGPEIPEKPQELALADGRFAGSTPVSGPIDRLRPAAGRPTRSTTGATWDGRGAGHTVSAPPCVCSVCCTALTRIPRGPYFGSFGQ